MREPAAIRLSSANLTSATDFESRHYTLGPALELAITNHIGVAFNPMYKRLGYTRLTTLTSPLGLPTNFSITRTRANAWEFPLIGKYYFGGADRAWRPFAGAGPSWATAWEHSVLTSHLLDPLTGGATGIPPLTLVSESQSPLRAGIVSDLGLIFQKGRFGWVPEFRYTHWAGAGPNDLRAKNQMELLVTFRF
jgi:hypothetical protein